MKRIALTLIGALALVVSACDGTQDSLTDGRRSDPRDPSATAGDENSTYDHSNDPGAQAPGAENMPPTDAAQVRVVGSPEVTSRLHSCGKLTYASLNALLQSRGITGAAPRPNGAQSAPQVLTASGPALGIANYNGRVPEAPFASTSAMSKMFDIFTLAAYDVAAANWTAPACPGVKVLGADNKFSKDGITCLIGKPARDEHVALANQAIKQAADPNQGKMLAISAMLSAAHTCE